MVAIAGEETNVGGWAGSPSDERGRGLEKIKVIKQKKEGPSVLM